MAFGAAWAFVPAWRRRDAAAKHVITTIMFNYLAATLGWCGYWWN